MPDAQPAPVGGPLPRGHLLALNRSFRRTLEAENKSPRTVEAYTDAVRFLARYCEAHGKPLLARQRRREHIQGFIADQLARWKPATATTATESPRLERTSAAGRDQGARGGGPEEAWRRVVVAGLEAPLQGLGLQGGHGHALAVDGAEAADGVPEGQQPVGGEAAQPFLAAPDAGRGRGCS